MTQTIYGINPDSNIGPADVRDAIVQCFFEAHCAQSELTTEDTTDVSKTYCTEIVRKAFSDEGYSFDTPTKEGILAAMENLKNFSASFRSPEVIRKHFTDILSLVGKLPESS